MPGTDATLLLLDVVDVLVVIDVTSEIVNGGGATEGERVMAFSLLGGGVSAAVDGASAISAAV